MDNLQQQRQSALDSHSPNEFLITCNKCNWIGPETDAVNHFDSECSKDHCPACGEPEDYLMDLGYGTAIDWAACETESRKRLKAVGKSWLDLSGQERIALMRIINLE